MLNIRVISGDNHSIIHNLGDDKFVQIDCSKYKCVNINYRDEKLDSETKNILNELAFNNNQHK